MNPLDFFFNAQGQPSNAPWFNPTTQGVSTFSHGINPAAMEASVDYGGQQLQYSTINNLTIGTLMGLFGSGVNNTVQQIFGYLQLAAQLYFGG